MADEQPEAKPEDKPEDDKITLYHYTNEEGARGIEESEAIKQSTTDDADAVFGDGVYLTATSPDTDKRDIAENNYDDGGALVEDAVDEGKVNYVVEVTLPSADVEKAQDTDRDVYVHKGDLDLSRDDVDYEIKKVQEEDEN